MGYEVEMGAPRFTDPDITPDVVFRGWIERAHEAKTKSPRKGGVPHKLIAIPLDELAALETLMKDHEEVE